MRYSITNNPNVRVFILEEIIKDFKGYIAGFGTSNSLVDNLFETDLQELFSELNPNRSKFRNNSALFTKKIENAVYKILDSPNGIHYASSYYTTKDLYKNAELSDTEFRTFAANVSFLLPQNSAFPPIDSSADNRISFPNLPNYDEGALIKAVIQEYDLDFQEAGKVLLLELSKAKKEKKGASDIEKINQKISKLNKDTLVHQTYNQGVPTADNPTCSAIVIRNNKVNFQGRNQNFLNFFLNAIPPLEMSRCTPYLDVTFFSRDKDENYMNNAFHMRFVENENGKMVLNYDSGMTLVKRFENVIKEKNTQATFMTAFTSPQTMANANINNDALIDGISSKFGEQVSNLFTSNTVEYKERYLEPIVPLMSLGGFNVTIDGMGYGTTASRKGSLDLIIHDRSRIKMFAPLVSLSQQANTSVRVEFGWSHPDGDPIKSENIFGKFLNASRDVQYYILNGSNLAFNDNSMNVNVKLASSGGENAIAVSAAAGYYIPLNYITRQINEAIDRVISKNNVTKKTQPNILEKMSVVKTRAGSLISLVTTKDYQDLMRAMKRDDDFETLKKVAEITKVADINSKEFVNAKTFKELSEVIKKSKLDSDYYKKLGYSAYAVIKNKLRALVENVTLTEKKKQITDPFIVDGKKTMVLGSRTVSHHSLNSSSVEISLGALIFQYVVSPMMATHRYSEVQAVFYPINDKAAGARKYTTASISLPVPILQNAINQIAKSGGQTSVKNMFKLITNLFDDTNLPVYGISNFTNYKDELITTLGGDQNLEKSARNDFISENAREPDEKELAIAIDTYVSKSRKTKLENELSDIYKLDGLGPVANNDFIKPDILMYFETLPVLPSNDVIDEKETGTKFDVIFQKKAEQFSNFLVSGAVNDYTENYFGQNKILRIHVYDREATSNPQSRFINDIINDNELVTFGGNLKNVHDILGGKIKTFKDVGSLINQLPIGVMKQFVKRNYPSITWGAMNSTVKSISVSSNTSDKISQQIMIRKIHEERTGNVSKRNESLQEEVQINPSSISVQLFGCPFLNRGNEIFVDMGTNTDLDNIYFVNSLAHVVKSGDFSTSLNLTLVGQGRITSTRNQIAKKIESIKTIVEESDVNVTDGTQ